MVDARDSIPIDGEPFAALTETELVERAKRDRDAFAVLYRTHVQYVGDAIQRRVGDAHVTQDLVAEVFLRAMRSLDRFQSRGVPFRFWLLRIATNLVSNWLTRHRRRWVTTAQVQDIPAHAASPEDHRRDELRRALAELAPRYQAVLTLHHVEGLGIDEVAAIVGVCPGTVKSRLARGRAALKQKVERRGRQS